jgi:hypothetical protein
MRKWLLPAAVVAAMVLAPSIAFADGIGGYIESQGGQSNGTGTLNSGGTLGFNAKEDLSGELEYHSPDGTLNVHCSGYNGYFDKVNKKGFKDVTTGSYNCTDPGGLNTYRVWLDCQDRGEGINDPQDMCHIRVLDSNGVLLVEERGPIQNGNVQIHM